MDALSRKTTFGGGKKLIRIYSRDQENFLSLCTSLKMAKEQRGRGEKTQKKTRDEAEDERLSLMDMEERFH